MAPRGETPSYSDGDCAGRPGQVDDVAEHLRGDVHGAYGGAAGREVGRAGDRPHPGAGQVARVEALGVPGAAR